MKCVICKNGETHPGLITITLKRDERTLVFKDIPADICETCGAYYLSEAISNRLYQDGEKSLK